jgi:hypothetical protein
LVSKNLAASTARDESIKERPFAPESASALVEIPSPFLAI